MYTHTHTSTGTERIRLSLAQLVVCVTISGYNDTIFHTWCSEATVYSAAGSAKHTTKCKSVAIHLWYKVYKMLSNVTPPPPTNERQFLLSTAQMPTLPSEHCHWHFPVTQCHSHWHITYHIMHLYNNKLTNHNNYTQVAVWRSGSALVSINEVNRRRARLVLKWVTVSGFNSRCRTFISVCDQPPRSTQPGHPLVSRCNEYQTKGGDALRLGSKARYGSSEGNR